MTNIKTPNIGSSKKQKSTFSTNIFKYFPDFWGHKFIRIKPIRKNKI